MLDNILNTVKRGAERVQRRGEEVASATRLRVEIFGLTRELDGLYARLGRSYHAGAEVDVLSGVREEIRRVEEEIRARERLITELGTEAAVVDEEPTASQPYDTFPGVLPTPHSPRPEATMSSDPVPTTPDPTVQHSDEKIVPGDQTASMGKEAARDQMARHGNMIEEGKAASQHPDPLDK